MLRHFHKVERVSVSPGKEVKAGNAFVQIGLHELWAVGLSQSASSTCSDLSSSFGKSCFSDMPPSAEPKPCFHEPWLSQLFWCHDSWLLLSLWKDSVPEGLPGSFRPGVPKDPMWHSEPGGQAEYPDRLRSHRAAAAVEQRRDCELAPLSDRDTGLSRVPPPQSTTTTGVWKGLIWKMLQNSRSLLLASSKSLLPRCFPTMSPTLSHSYFKSFG